MKGDLRNSGIVSNSKQGASHLSRDNVLTNRETKSLQKTPKNGHDKLPQILHSGLQFKARKA